MRADDRHLRLFADGGPSRAEWWNFIQDNGIDKQDDRATPLY